MDTFSSNSVGSIEIVKRPIVPTRVTHSRLSSEGARGTSVRAPRNLESLPTKSLGREALSLSDSASGGVG